MNSTPHNKTARVTAIRQSTEVVAPTSRSLVLDAGRDFRRFNGVVRSRVSDAEHRSGAGSRVSTRSHIRNAFVAAEYSMSVSRNSHLLMRSAPHERFSYVALPPRFALTGRGFTNPTPHKWEDTFRTLGARAHKVRESRPPGSVRGHPAMNVPTAIDRCELLKRKKDVL
jgi:hypothetical protein